MKDKIEEKLKILELLKTTPVISVACAKAGLARATIYRWLNDDIDFKKQVQQALRSGAKNINDLAYAKLIQKINESSLGAITFYLSHRHPLFKKKEKFKVEVTQKNSPIFDIPESAFNEVLISKLPKKLRKQVVRKAIRIHEIVRQAIEKARKERPYLGPKNPSSKYCLQDTLPWGLILKSVLEEEKGKK